MSATAVGLERLNGLDLALYVCVSVFVCVVIVFFVGDKKAPSGSSLHLAIDHVKWEKLFGEIFTFPA